MSRITEKRDVQDQLINYLSGIGWTFIPQNELLAWRDHDEHESFSSAMLRSKLTAEGDGLTALQALLKSMFHQLMTGQIRLLSDEGLPKA